LASLRIVVRGLVATMLASWAACAHAGAVTEPSLKGYGIKGVEGGTLSDMLARCAVGTSAEASVADGEGPALLAARCAQLRRSLHNQPGNGARAVR
jgi:NCAIR mutase (PurE)-related protein